MNPFCRGAFRAPVDYTILIVWKQSRSILRKTDKIRHRKDNHHEKIHNGGIIADSGGTHIPCDTNGNAAYPKNRP